MKIAVIEIYPLKKINIYKMQDAHLRNSRIIAEYLGADLLLIENDYKKALTKKYDVLIQCYGARYAPFNSIEAVFKNNDGKLDELLSELKTRLNFILTELKRLTEMNLPTQDSIEGKSISTDKLLTELRTLLEDDDTEAVNLLNTLIARFSSTEQEQSMKNVVKLVNDYEFEEALDILNSLQN